MIYTAKHLVTGDGKTYIENGAFVVNDEGIISAVVTIDDIRRK